MWEYKPYKIYSIPKYPVTLIRSLPSSISWQIYHRGQLANFFHQEVDKSLWKFHLLLALTNKNSILTFFHLLSTGCKRLAGDVVKGWVTESYK